MPSSSRSTQAASLYAIPLQSNTIQAQRVIASVRFWAWRKWPICRSAVWRVLSSTAVCDEISACIASAWGDEQELRLIANSVRGAGRGCERVRASIGSGSRKDNHKTRHLRLEPGDELCQLPHPAIHPTVHRRLGPSNVVGRRQRRLHRGHCCRSCGCRSCGCGRRSLRGSGGLATKPASHGVA